MKDTPRPVNRTITIGDDEYAIPSEMTNELVIDLIERITQLRRVESWIGVEYIGSTPNVVLRYLPDPLAESRDAAIKAREQEDAERNAELAALQTGKEAA